MELAEAIGVSMQAVSKWETDIGMPDISQIVPLSRELAVSADILLGITCDETDAEFEALYAECMEAERVPACNWPIPAEKLAPYFQRMYEYFSEHPNHPQAADYLLDQTEFYWGKYSFFESESVTVKECERFANCIFRHSDNADMQAKARYLLACVWARTEQTEKADEILAKLPFQYSDRSYYAAEVAKKAGNYEKAEAFCRESFTRKARFVSRCIRLTASLPSKNLSEKTEYGEYMLRIINAFLSGGDYMPHRQIYQKMSLISGLIKQHYTLGNITRAEELFHEFLETSEKYLAFLENGAQGKTLLLLDDGLDMQEKDRNMEHRRALVFEYLKKTADYFEHMEKTITNTELTACIQKAKTITEKYIG